MLDGEVVVLRPDGRSSFQALQQALSGTTARSGLVYVLFDLLRLDGAAADGPAARGAQGPAARTCCSAGTTGRLRYADHVVGNGPAFFAEAQAHGLEGIVSKRRTGTYSSGPARRMAEDQVPAPAAVRHRRLHRPGGRAPMPSARCSSAATTGAVWRSRAASARASPRRSHRNCARASCQQERATSPFNPPPEGEMAKGAYYVAPTLVCEVAFTEWTGDDRIRHPSFLGLLEDMKPRSVTRQRS